MKRLTVQHLRNAKDRLRHAVIYEIVGLTLAVPLAAWGFGTDLVETGALGIFFSILAMIWGLPFFISGTPMCTIGPMIGFSPIRCLNRNKVVPDPAREAGLLYAIPGKRHPRGP